MFSSVSTVAFQKFETTVCTFLYRLLVRSTLPTIKRIRMVELLIAGTINSSVPTNGFKLLQHHCTSCYPTTARQLFTSTVAPVVDYASNVWMHAFKDKAIGPINRVQRVGAQAIVGTFLTVATSVAEAEAHIATAQHRFWRRAVKMWTDIHTLPETNRLRRNTARIKKFRRYHRSPLYQVADALKNIEMETLEPHGRNACRPIFMKSQRHRPKQADACRSRSAVRHGTRW